MHGINNCVNCSNWISFFGAIRQTRLRNETKSKGCSNHTTNVQTIVQFSPYTLQGVPFQTVNNSSNAASEFLSCCNASQELFYKFDIQNYTGHLPYDLQPTVKRALKVERGVWDEPCEKEEQITCPPNKFRRPSGECNNIRHSQWGNRGTRFLRVLPPQYLHHHIAALLKEQTDTLIKQFDEKMNSFKNDLLLAKTEMRNLKDENTKLKHTINGLEKTLKNNNIVIFARDHGIPSYNNYRALCNLKRATSFDDLAREIPPEIIARFKKIYATVDDIDLFPGGMSERPLKGGLVGPTFACIIAIQFRQLRKCDRFWYENSDPVVRFTETQLAEIRKTTLAKSLCNNLDIHSDIQRAAFDLPSNFLNPRVPCNSLPDIDFNAWREQSNHGCILRDRHLQIGDSAFPSPCTSCICAEDGVQCASLKITDCSQLMKEWPRDVILRDDVCTAQCGFFLRDSFNNFNIKTASALTQTSVSTGLIPPPTRTVRSRPVLPYFNSNTNPFNGFKFPDLTQFIV
ncbi:hypothetical protein QE152_g36830 [Popillia japonica]|uniref:Uncharacterized protein n=1 Tax=Popillia japonica TaxID=7064 RepID=A0AAW1ICJ6_POPJA